MEKKIFVVIISLVFGGVDLISAFATEEEANHYIIKWANDNNSYDITFKTAFEALEWFRINEEKIEYTIQLHITTINL